MPRVLQVLGLTLSALIGAVLGATGVALGTAAGRNVLVGTGLAFANRAIDGRLTVGSVGGSLLRGLEARDVTIVGSDGVPFAQVPRLSVRYRLRELLGGRIVLGQVTLHRPDVSVIQQPDGRFNFHRIFRLGGPSGGGSRPLIAFRDVEVDSATVMVKTRAGEGDTARYEFVPEVAEGFRIRRFRNLSASLPYLRLSSPFAGENPILLEIEQLRARVTDPAMVIRDARGRAEIEGDSITVNLPRFLLATSKASLRGVFSWPRDTLMFNIVAETRDALLDDIRSLVPVVPRGLEGAGRFTIQSLAGNITAVDLDNLALAGRRGGGTLTGRIGMVLGPRQAWSSRKTAVTADNLDLEYVRPFLDTLPVAGRLTGTVTADGPHDHLSVEADVVFRDSLVPGWPRSSMRAYGVLTVAQPDGVTFQDFDVEAANIDMKTVRRIIPAAVLQGFISGEGMLNGPWLEASFDGTLHHVDEPFPVTTARGTIQVDARRDTLGVWARLAFDSLELPGFWTSFPGFNLLGTLAGDVKVGGYVDSLDFEADLSGPGGRFKGSTVLVMVSPHYAARGLDFRFDSLDVRRFVVERVPTSLNGRVTGHLDTDTLRPPVGAFALTIDPSTVGGSPLDSVRASVALADSLVRVDSALAWAPKVRVSARGGLGLAAPRRDSLVVTAVLDSASALESVLAGYLELPEDSARRPLGGAMTLHAGIAGATDDFEIAGTVTAPSIRWGSFSIGSADIRGVWSSRSEGRARLIARIDSLGYGNLGFAFVVAGLAGQRDSLSWAIRARNGPDASVMLGGAAMFDAGATRIALDSARLALPSIGWTLVHPTVITVRDSSLDLGTLTMAGADGRSKVEAVGTIPLDGHGRLTVNLSEVSLKDLFAMLQRESANVGGVLNGTVDVAGTARAPQAHADLTLTNVLYQNFRMPRIEGLLDYAARRLQGAFTLRSATAVVMQIEADLPLDLAMRGAAPDRTIPGNLSIRARADSVDLAIAEAISTAVDSASGRLDGDFGIIGTWERPQLSGAISVRNGAATYPGIGTRHRDINGRLVMHGDTLQIERLGMRSNSGTLAVTGNIRLEELTHPVLDLNLSAREFFAMDVRNFVTVTASGEFTLAGPMIGATFSGRGLVPRGTLHFADLLNKRIINLEDTLFRDVIDTTLIRRQGLEREFQNIFIDSLVVDSLRLEMGDDVWLRSTEANIQLAGSVVFSKTADVYRVEGVLTTPRGSYQLPLGTQVATREFTVMRGEIRMLGTPDLNAFVDIDARFVVRRRVGENVNVFVHIGGTLYNPVLTLSSDVRPPLPESEIIAYLLFGGPLNTSAAGSQGQQALVQSALSAIAGQIENVLLANLSLPISPDYFQISPGQGLVGTQVQFGWQVNVFGIPAFITPSGLIGCQRKGVLVGVSMEVRLNQNFRVAGSIEPVRGCNTSAPTAVGAQRQAGLDVLWEMNY